MPRPLEGLLVIALEQAVAAPLCTCRLADAGARVIKIERPEGDFARGYDALARGESSYFVWLNRGKQSVVLNLALADDRALLETMIGRADIFVQNLKPGAIDRLGFSRQRLRADYPALIMASISGFGDDGPYAGRKSYDLLIQAEAGLSSVTGSPDTPARIGVSVVDIATGSNTYEAILEALLMRAKTGAGADIRVSMFDSMAEWSAVPLLQHRGGQTPQRMGLAHPTIAPYGVFSTRDGAQLLISIQSDREWQVFATSVLGDAALALDAQFATNVKRVAQRAQTDACVQAAFAKLDANALITLLMRHDIAFGQVNDMAALNAHPHLRQIAVETERGRQFVPAPASLRDSHACGPVPALGQHTAAIKAEFATPTRANPSCNEA